VLESPSGTYALGSLRRVLVDLFIIDSRRTDQLAVPALCTVVRKQPCQHGGVTGKGECVVCNPPSCVYTDEYVWASDAKQVPLLCDFFKMISTSKWTDVLHLEAAWCEKCERCDARTMYRTCTARSSLTGRATNQIGDATNEQPACTHPAHIRRAHTNAQLDATEHWNRCSC
jgi:hypothetical protein